MQRSFKVALTAILAALHALLYFFSFDLWRNWAVFLEPIEGIVLGPWAGFSSALLGSIIGRMVKPIDFWMFGIIAEPLGVLATGFLAKGKWRPVIALYAVMLAAYFAHPFGRWLPLWAILDILLAMALIYPVSKLSKNLYDNAGRMSISVHMSFIGTVTDALTRVFLFIPAGFYTLLFKLSDEAVYNIYVLGAIYSYIEDAQVIIISILVVAPVLLALRKIRGFEYPIT